MSKEIDFKTSNHTLITGLNHYSASFDPTHSKKWSLEWIKDNLPEELDRLSKENETKFSNRGFVCRMIKNGLQVSDKQKADLAKFFKGIISDPVEEKQIDDTAPKRKPAEKVNSIIFQMEDVIDAILSDNEPNTVEIPVDKAQLREAQAWLEKEIIEVQDQVKKQQAILDQLSSVFQRVGGIKEKLVMPIRKVTKVKDDKTSLTADKAKAVKTMKPLKGDPTLKLETLSPARIVGAKQVMTYTPKYKIVSIYKAKPGEVLNVSGTSIRNFDEEKSVSRSVRKPVDFFALPDQWNAFGVLTSTIRKPSPRVNSDTIILSVK